jgi:hypothetical protein
MDGNLGFGDPIGAWLAIAAALGGAYLALALLATAVSVAGGLRSRRRPA